MAASSRPEPAATPATGAGRVPAASPPLLSVIVVTYNCRELVRVCLESLNEERERVPMEVIVVDSGSSDGTVPAIRDQFAWVQAVASPNNLGFARANNRGLEFATGDYVLFLNPDTVVPPGALAASLDALSSRPEVGMLGCKLVRPDGSLDHACKRGFPTPLSSLYHFVGLTRVRPRSPCFARYTAGHVDSDETATVDAVNGAFMLVRREALEAVGPMDEDYWLWMEDLDWCYRFWQRGWPILYWPGATVVHVKGGSSGGRRAWHSEYDFHRGMWVFYRKHYAAQRSPLTTAGVWLGIWSKLALSRARGRLRRGMGRR
jgi:GT2 family glycosyltransferase